MAEQLFDLVIVGHNSQKPTDVLIKEIVTVLGNANGYTEFKVSDALLFRNAMASIHEAVTRAEAEDLCKKLSQLNVKCEFRPTWQLVEKDTAVPKLVSETIYTCPACGHTQPKMKPTSSGTLMETCHVCGIVGERYKLKQRRERILEQERARIEHEQNQSIKQAVEQAELNEDHQARKDLRLQMGVDNNAPRIPKAITIAIGLLVIAGVILYVATQRNHHPAQAKAEAAIEALDKKMADLKAAQPDATSQKELDATMEKLVFKANAAANLEQAMQNMAKKDEASIDQAIQQATQKANHATETALSDDDTTQADAETQALDAKMADALQKAEQLVTKLDPNTNTPNTTTHPTNSGTQTKLQAAEAKKQVTQYLNTGDIKLAQNMVEQAPDAYARTLALLEIGKYQLQHSAYENARTTFQRMYGEINQAKTPTEQALIMGALSHIYTIMEDNTQANTLLQQAVNKAKTLPTAPEQAALLIRLANEQALLGNQTSSNDLLQTANQLMTATPP